MIEQELHVSNILFPPESANPRRESLVDIQRASKALRNLPLNSSQLNLLFEWLKDNIQQISYNIGWWSGKGPIFSHLIRIFAALDNLSFRHMDTESLSGQLSDILSSKDTFHPIIIQLLDNFQS